MLSQSHTHVPSSSCHSLTLSTKSIYVLLQPDSLSILKIVPPLIHVGPAATTRKNAPNPFLSRQQKRLLRNILATGRLKTNGIEIGKIQIQRHIGIGLTLKEPTMANIQVPKHFLRIYRLVKKASKGLQKKRRPCSPTVF